MLYLCRHDQKEVNLLSILHEADSLFHVIERCTFHPSSGPTTRIRNSINEYTDRESDTDNQCSASSVSLHHLRHVNNQIKGWRKRWKKNTLQYSFHRPISAPSVTSSVVVLKTSYDLTQLLHDELAIVTIFSKMIYTIDNPFFIPFDC